MHLSPQDEMDQQLTFAAAYASLQLSFQCTSALLQAGLLSPENVPNA
jgi:hypothetical protein